MPASQAKKPSVFFGWFVWTRSPFASAATLTRPAMVFFAAALSWLSTCCSARTRTRGWFHAVTVLVLALVRFRGPAPKPASAPAGEFSAERALALHREVVGSVPHPVGSAEHDAVRDRLVARFRALGYDTAIQQRFACSPYATCAPVQNVIARRPGDAAGDVVLMAAHYDSVGAGPGASDDGNGVAAMLEIARAVRGERTRNPIVFLVTDAEEQGLIGAEGFVADPAAAHDVAVIVNVEARGTSGPSFLFETSRHNQWLIPIVARALPRPATSSLFFNIYELLPND